MAQFNSYILPLKLLFCVGLVICSRRGKRPLDSLIQLLRILLGIFRLACTPKHCFSALRTKTLRLWKLMILLSWILFQCSTSSVLHSTAGCEWVAKLKADSRLGKYFWSYGNWNGVTCIHLLMNRQSCLGLLLRASCGECNTTRRVSIQWTQTPTNW